MRLSVRTRLSLAAATVLAVASVCLVTPAFATGGPAFVQQASAHSGRAASITALLPAATTAGNRLVVEVGVWGSGAPTASAVTDDAGDTFVKLLSFTASDHTEMSVWTAPVATGGTRPTITARPSAAADLGVVVLEYAGLSSAADATVLDQQAHATGSTGAAATVSSGATGPAAAGNELALGFYADSGFSDGLTAAGGFTARATVAPAGDMELLAEDSAVSAGDTPAAAVQSSARTVWLMATVVLRGGTSAPPTLPGAPTGVGASAGDGTAVVSWTAPSNGGATITSYTVTPYVGSTAQASSTVTGTPPATTATVTGLTDGTAYTFTVTATNAVGTGPASAPSAPVTPAAQQGGQWSALQTWPIVALSNSLLYNGSVVAWDGWQQPQPAVVWNPASPQTFTTINAPDSVFCDGGASLPDGRLLVVGGYGGLTTGALGIVDTNIFDPATNRWSRVADMRVPRWYPSLTELADGRYVAVSGNSTNSVTWADTPEVYDPVANTWTLLPGVSTPQVHEDEYPFSYLLPSGKVFTVGPNEDNSFLLDVPAQTWTPVGGTSGVHNGSSVMYRPGKVLYTGGGTDVNAAGPSFATSSVIDLTAATPTWQQIAPMKQARVYHTLTMLADGKVLAVGGSSTTDQGVVTTGVLPAEIWDPATQTWTQVAGMDVSRNYHSTALLMPDGRVLVAGGGHPFGLNNPGQYSAQYYSPPYLSNGARPTITSAPASATYGSTLSVSTPDAASISGVNLVSLGADTHQLDMNQHFVPLSFTAHSGGLNITAPSAAELAPPGYYMLFILNDKGVPSTAQIVRLAKAITAPAAPGSVNASPGNASATVSWSAPSDGGSPITSYTLTPFIGGTAQPSTTVSGNPPATSTTVGGLTNGTAYTFTVKATNAAGTSPASVPSGGVTPSATPAPAFVQQAGGHVTHTGSLAVSLPTALRTGDRLVVEVGVWNSANGTATGVSDSAGDSFVEVSHGKASDGTELSVWTAPVTAGAGQSPAITATASGAADIGVAASEYSGLSTVADASVVDTQASATGSVSAGSTVSSGATPAVAAGNELAIGFYADSGFGHALSAGTGWSARANVSPNGDMDLLTEDQPVGAGAAPAATAGTGGNAIWRMATVVFKSAAGAPPPTAPAAPTGVNAVPGNGSATVSWTAPASGGSPITSYTVTPYVGGTAQAPTLVGGNPPATSVTVAGLTNGTAYTFTVSATNAIGTGPASAASGAVTPTSSPPPAFVQQASGFVASTTSFAVSTTGGTTPGDRLVVEVAEWGGAGPTTSGVTDSAGDVFTRVASVTGSDRTQLSVWTAVASGSTPVTVTATTTASADIGIAVTEYAGLSTAAGTGAVDQSAQATGSTTGSPATVTSGPTPATTAGGNLAIGFYADSGFVNALTGDPAYAVRTNQSPNGLMELLVQDKVVPAGSTPAPGTGTGSGGSTVWLAATVVFKHG